MRRFRFGLPGFAGAVLLALFLALALFPDAVAGRDPLEQEVSRRLLPPGREHPFGTDGFGRDVFSRVVHGTRISLGCAVLAFGAAAVLGISAGTVSA